MVRQMTNLDEEAERRKKANAPNYVPLPIPGVPPYSETSDGQPSDVQTKKRKENSITKLYDVKARNHLDAEIARMFYTGGLPFNLILWKKLLKKLVPMNVVQVITDNASNCKGAGELIEIKYPWIYWTPCVVHTLNLALKNICAARNIESNIETYDECHWITQVHDDAVQVKNFIMNLSMRLAMFNRFSSLKLIAVADTRFASVVVMLKRFKLLRRSLEAMVISEEWGGYKEDDQGKASFVKEKVMSDSWWDKVDYILAFTGPIYEMIRACDTDKPSLHLVYEMWDSMLEKVKIVIYTHEGLTDDDDDITPSFLKFYSEAWLEENPNRVPPHRDTEISEGRVSCFRRLFPDNADFARAMDEYTIFSYKSEYLGQPTSSSCCERNWSIYSFIHSLRRNRLNPKRAENLVKIHTNLRLLSRNTNEYTAGKTKLWDVGGDQFDVMDDGNDENAFLEFADLSLDEPDLEFAQNLLMVTS
ncbi:uncharacterized protein LOC130591372 [Beta vulgaris subsp. vulgaris]|uniref:uncharacterized protein LOC130591372 n=1 Tax=Beta vulgaris subsp. vulgaris TaxID=3555 RepID=UPI0025477C2E|nr:uncharacterized protein LOC130591372 [Beta vulgaris subsp. vulgaris]